MKKRIVGILVCMLLIVATTVPVEGTINKNEKYDEVNGNSKVGFQSSNKCAFSRAINENSRGENTLRKINQNVNSIDVEITKPTGGLYISDRKIIPLQHAIIIGRITVAAKVTDDDGIERVEFYINNDLKYIDNNAPYEWLWDETVFSKQWIKVVAYDNVGESASDEIEASIFNVRGRLNDIDGDGLSNWEELIIYRTDPYDPDTDNDGLLDGWEIAHGFDPLVPTIFTYVNEIGFSSDFTTNPSTILYCSRFEQNSDWLTQISLSNPSGKLMEGDLACVIINYYDDKGLQ